MNFYPSNEWIYQGPALRQGDDFFRPLRELLAEVHARYCRPMFIAETGAEGHERPAWLRYVGTEARAAMDAGVPLHGICLYPIVNHPGWVDERHCPNGLWDYPDDRGHRPIYGPLADELERLSHLLFTRPARSGASWPTPLRIQPAVDSR